MYWLMIASDLSNQWIQEDSFFRIVSLWESYLSYIYTSTQIASKLEHLLIMTIIMIGAKTIYENCIALA